MKTSSIYALALALSVAAACDSKPDCSRCPGASAAPKGASASVGKTAPAKKAKAQNAATPDSTASTKAATKGMALSAPGGVKLSTVGSPPKVGAAAPSFRVARFVPGNRVPETASWQDTWKGKPLIVSVVPSLDTPVCETQTSMIQSKFADGNYAGRAALVTVSRDLPFAMARFAETHPGATLLYSDFKYRDLGINWGIEVAETGLLARSVWVLDAAGKVVYAEVVNDQSAEPQYDPVFTALDSVLKGS